MTAPPDVTTGDVRDTVDRAVAAAFTAATAARARSSHHLGLSGLGGCTKAAAYALAGTPVSDVPAPEQGRAAQLGTYLHAGLLPDLAGQLPAATHEVPTVLHAAGLEIPGTLDLVDDELLLLLDLKTVGEWRLHGVRRDGEPYADHRLQVMGYALARLQSGQPVRWVAWLYLDRASGDHEIIVERFTNASALAVIDRVRELKEWSAQPDAAPREGRGPGMSFACDRCPWLRRCWGDDAVPGQVGAQRNIARDDPAVASLLAMLDDASARRSAANDDYEYAKACLAAARNGVYGDWSLRRSKSGSLLVRLVAALTPKMLAELSQG